MPRESSRRRFLKQSALSAAGIGTLISGQASGEEPRPRGRSKVRIGTRISPAWLKSANDNDLRFLKQIGVDYVDITLDAVKGYQETGAFTQAALKEYLDRIEAVGLRVERANSLNPFYLNAHLGKPE